MKIYIGWDYRDDTAYKVCEASLRKHSSIPLEIVCLREKALRDKKLYWRTYRVDEVGQMWDDRDGKPFSTQFSFTRFAVPMLENFDSELAIFIDPDFLIRGDVAELVSLCTGDKALWCVKHNHVPAEKSKMDGVRQELYRRKNWSSLMVFKPWHQSNRLMNQYALNNWTGQHLHALGWLTDEEIGELPEAWNWLEGWCNSEDPKAVHFTRGTPDMLQGLPYADEWWEYARQ